MNKQGYYRTHIEAREIDTIDYRNCSERYSKAKQTETKVHAADYRGFSDAKMNRIAQDSVNR